MPGQRFAVWVSSQPFAIRNSAPALGLRELVFVFPWSGLL